MEPIHIAAASDDLYAQHLGVMLTSLLENCERPERLHVHILDGGIFELNRNRLKEVVEKYGARLSMHAIEKSRFARLKISNRINHVTYFRLLLPELLPYEIQKLIYLDSDIIVKEDIARLWSCDISSFAVAAVDNSNLDRFKDLNIPVSFGYFNAGVLLMNLDYWRKHRVAERVLEYLQTHEERIIYHDQDGLNAVLYDQWLPLPPRWNQRSNFYYTKADATRFTVEELHEAVTQPAIIHYTEASKPWHFLNHHPLKQEYHRYRALTPWAKEEPPEDKVLMQVLTSKRVIIFGTGKSSEELTNLLREKNIPVHCYIDNARDKWFGRFMDKEILPPERLVELDADHCMIIIASMYYNEISEQLIRLGFVPNKHFIIKGFESNILKAY